MEKIEMLGIEMHSATMAETVAWLDTRIAEREFTQHVVVNVAKIVNMRRDRVLSDSVRSCDIVNIDGMGVVWAARLLGHEVPERVSGVDLFGELVRLAALNAYPVFLLGAKEEVVEKVADTLRKRYPTLKMAGYHHGYFWEDEEALVNKIRYSGARLLFVAITSPKKENFINRWKDYLGVDLVMGVGGTFDVVAGRVKRAPAWMQKSGLEWLYRVIQEPRRMWKRYLVTNCLFAAMMFREMLRVRKYGLHGG